MASLGTLYEHTLRCADVRCGTVHAWQDAVAGNVIGRQAVEHLALMGWRRADTQHPMRWLCPHCW